MSIVLEIVCYIFLFAMTLQVKLFTFIGVAGCGCTIYYNVVYNTMDYLALIKRAAQSAPEADAIAF